ncbi:hypothetical protein D0Y50_12555 [Salinimonas sediminis]|uniref:Uncharacterized protein n=1 Tax=Salinimonas sediminis TaxID=2303538 RepID=A0A346NNK0_9ALTE|nr:hypothetical protein D0Y50_12555 [Salinimonas sediminis]
MIPLLLILALKTKNPRKFPSEGLRNLHLRHWKETIPFQHEPERLCYMVVMMVCSAVIHKVDKFKIF